jgi:hypothetical protein
MIGAPGCVVNAVNDALSDTGASFDHIPVLPAELSAALAGDRAGGALDSAAAGVTGR